MGAKFIITILLLLITLISRSQTLDNVKVYSISQDTVKTGDSLTIKFHVYYSGGSNMAKIQLWTSTYLQDCFYAYAGFWTQDTSTIKVAITSIMGTGNARIYSNGSPYKPFYIKSTVGIQELYSKPDGHVQYYDILGNEKTPEVGGLFIKVTSYSNGYQKKEKIIFQ